MTYKQPLYDELCRVLTDYEDNNSLNGVKAGDLYNMLVKIQNQWENVVISNEEDFVPRPKANPHGILTDWFSGTGPYAYEANGYHNALIRVRKNADFDYLYVQRQYQGTGIKRKDGFDYAGIYCKQDGLIYDGLHSIEKLFDDTDFRTAHSANALCKRLETSVRSSVESAIGNDRNNLRITEISSEKVLKELEYFQEYTAGSQARAAYLSSDYTAGDIGFDFMFRCDYSPEQWTEDSLLAYILDPGGYVHAEVKKYIDNEQESMLSEFLMNDMVAAAYQVIIDNPSNPVHLVKRIMYAVSASSAKTVKVTIRKDGVEFTFKTEASEFRSDCTSYYSTWNIAAADRREFERLFGRSSNYRPEDILRIEYARSVLYGNEAAGSQELDVSEM